MFSYNGTGYPVSLNQTMVGNKETLPANFIGYAQQAYKSNGVVFAVQLARISLFSMPPIPWQNHPDNTGRPGKLFGTQALDILEQPWSRATTAELLARAIQDADLAGNFYGVVRNGQIKRMRPDWVTILLGLPGELETFPGDLDAV